ncbi:hypothetical protein RFI_00032, partial [Reticulomyxa filosa]
MSPALKFSSIHVLLDSLTFIPKEYSWGELQKQPNGYQHRNMALILFWAAAFAVVWAICRGLINALSTQLARVCLRLDKPASSRKVKNKEVQEKIKGKNYKKLHEIIKKEWSTNKQNKTKFTPEDIALLEKLSGLNSDEIKAAIKEIQRHEFAQRQIKKFNETFYYFSVIPLSFLSELSSCMTSNGLVKVILCSSLIAKSKSIHQILSYIILSNL